MAVHLAVAPRRRRHGSRERPNIGRRTGGPQFTHLGVYRAPPTAPGSVAARSSGRAMGRRHPEPSDGGMEEPLAPAAASLADAPLNLPDAPSG